MELLADCFVKEYEPPTNCTAIHRLVRPISRELVRERLGEKDADYFTLANVHYIEAACARTQSTMARSMFRATQIYAYWLLGKKRTAQEAAREMIDEYNLSAHAIERRPSFNRLFAELGVAA